MRQWWNEGMVIAALPDEQPAVPDPTPVAPPPPSQPPPPEPPLPAERRPWREIVRPAIIRVNPEPPSDESTLEHTLLDFDRRHQGEKPGVRALWELLAHVRDVAQKERVIYERDLDRVRIDELWNFRVGLAAAMVGLIVFAAGAYLVLFDSMKVGGLSMLLGLLGGRGTYLTRQYAKSLKEKREYLQRRQRDIDESVTAIHATLSNPDRAARTTGMRNSPRCSSTASARRAQLAKKLERLPGLVRVDAARILARSGIGRSLNLLVFKDYPSRAAENQAFCHVAQQPAALSR